VDGTGRFDAGVVPLGVTRPPGTLRLAGLAMAGQISQIAGRGRGPGRAP
jgi:hypothetical protein